MTRPAISARQMALLISTFIFTAYDNTGWQLARAAGHDSIFSYGAPIFYAFLIALLFYTLSKKFPGKNIFEISVLIAGRIGGTIINVVILLQIWMIFVRDLTRSTGFLTNILLRFTQPEILILLFVCVMIYYGKTSVEVAARVNEFIFLVFAAVYITLPLALSNEISLSQWEPILTQRPAQIILGNVYGAVQFSDMFLIGAFLHTLQNARQLHAALRHGMTMAAMWLTFLTTLCVAVFGDSVFANLRYPAYVLSTQLHISDFLDRMEIFLYISYLPLLIINAVISFIAFQTGFTSFSKRSSPILYSRSLGWLLMLTALIAFRNSSELMTFYMYAYPVFVIAVQPLMIGLFFVLAARFKTVPASQEDNDRSGHPATAKPKSRMSNGSWMRLTHFTVCGIVLLVPIGMALASRYPLIGNLCLLGYGLCMMFAVYTTYNEIKSA